MARALLQRVIAGGMTTGWDDLFDGEGDGAEGLSTAVDHPAPDPAARTTARRLLRGLSSARPAKDTEPDRTGAER